MAATDTAFTTSASDVRQKALIAGLNATVLYVLAYLLANTLYQAATVAMAVRLSIRGVWELERVKFLIADGEWVRIAVLAVYSVGPLLCAGLGVAAALWFWYSARLKRGLLKLFLVWVALHCCNLFFGAMVADTFTENGFWYIPSWLFLAGNGPNIAVAVVFGLIQMVLGYFAAILFLQSHDSITLMKYVNRRVLIYATLFAPWLVGSLVLALAKFPHFGRNEQLHFATMLLLLAPLSFAAANELFEFTLEAPQKTRIAWGLVVLALVVLVAMRLVLGPGIHFA
ncbi:hypothetical protein [Hymenobacter koreensis]|uniref:Uncharacterized protein n=1 Tax=Hymenobacter koreensis TaxID=1084523 RepID=A0ABP8J8F6_9BACT